MRRANTHDNTPGTIDNSITHGVRRISSVFLQGEVNYCEIQASHFFSTSDIPAAVIQTTVISLLSIGIECFAGLHGIHYADAIDATLTGGVLLVIRGRVLERTLENIEKPSGGILEDKYSPQVYCKGTSHI